MQIASNLQGRRRTAPPDRGGSAETIAHCKNNWLPFVLNIPDSFSSTTALREFLIRNCSEDPLFFLSVTRAGVELFGVSAEDTIDFLQTADTNSLKRLLSTTQGYANIKNIDGATPIQSRKIQQIALAVGAARVVSEKVSVNVGSGFLIGALPLLGHLLYAWNYPTLYASAVSRSRKTNRPIEEFLAAMLKLTPLELSYRITRSWQITPDTQRAIEAKSSEDSKMFLVQQSAILTPTIVDPHASKASKEAFMVLRSELQQKYSFDLKQQAEEFSKNVLSYVHRIHPALDPTTPTTTPLTIAPTFFAFEPKVQSIVKAVMEAESLPVFLNKIQALLGAFDITKACIFRYETKGVERLIPLITLLANSDERAPEITALHSNPLGVALFSQVTKVFPQGIVFNKENQAITSTTLINRQFCLLYAEIPATIDSIRVAKATRAMKDCIDIIKRSLERFLSDPDISPDLKI